MDAYERLTREELISLLRKYKAIEGPQPVSVQGNVSDLPVFGEQEQREFETSPWPLRISDRETLQYLAVNDAALRLYGYTRNEFLGLTLLDTRHPEDRADKFGVLSTPTGHLLHPRQRRHVKKTGEIMLVEVVVQDIVFNGRKAALSLTVDVTERARLQETRPAHEREFAALIENTPDIISRIDRSFRHVYVNPAVMTATGRPPEAFIGKTIAEVDMPPDLVARWSAVLSEAFATGCEQNLESAYSGHNGARYYESRIVPERHNGNIETVLIITRDFTERKYAEDLLRHRDREFERLAENIPDCVVRFDRWNRYMYVNAAVEALTGMRRQDMLGKTKRELGMPDSVVTAFERSHEEVIRTGRSHSFEFNMNWQDGERFFEAQQVPEIGPDKQEVTVLCIARDITERKKYDRAVQRNLTLTELLSSLARAANEAMTPEAAMSACLERICKHGGWDLGRVLIFEPSGLGDTPPRSVWYAPERQRFLEFIDVSNNRKHGGDGDFISRTLREQVPVWIEDLAQASKFYRKPVAIRHGITSGFAFPIIVHGAVVALMEVFSTRRRPRDLQLIDAAQTLASQLSRIVERERTQRSNARLAAIVESSQDAIILRAVDGTVLTWNVGAERLFGYSASEIVGRNIDLLMPDDMREDAANRRAQLMRGIAVQDFETVRISKGGRRIDVSQCVSPVRDASGEIFAVSNIMRDITERKQVERELQHQKKLLDAVIDNLPVSVVVKDAKTFRLMMANRVAEEMSVLGAVIAIGKTAHEVFPQEQADAYLKTDLQALQSRRMVEIAEQQVIGKSGETRIRHTRKVPIFTEDGEPWVLLGIGDDITEKKSAERELERQKKLLDTIIEHLPVGVAVKDAVTRRYLVRNRLTNELTGTGNAVAIGKRADEIFPPALAALIEAADNQALASGGVVVASPLVAQTGSGRIVRNLKVPVPDEFKRHTHIVSILDDVTDIAQAQTALRRSEQRLSQLISMSPAAIFSLSLDKSFRATSFISDNVTAQVGWQASDFTSDRPFWSEHIHPDDRARSEEAISRAAIDGKYRCEYRFRHKDGHWRWMREEGRTVCDESGGVYEIIGSWSDVTAEHMASEMRVRRALLQRDTLVREVHHRIKNNIQGVIGLLRRKVKKYPASVPELEEAITQLQTVATVYGLAGSGANTPLTLSALLDSICALTENLAGEVVTRTYQSKSSQPLRVVAEEAVAVAVALNELIFNALKHRAIEADKMPVRIALDEDNGFAVIRITNHGQLSSTFDFGRGYGVNNGLDLVRSLLLQPGGEVTFNSEGGEVEVVLKLRPPLVVATPAAA